MIELLKFKRVGSLTNRVVLKSYQRILVNYFKRYTVQESELGNEAHGRRKLGIGVSVVARKCQP